MIDEIFLHFIFQGMNSTDDAPSVGEQLLSNSQMILVISFYVVIFIVALFGNSIGLYVVFVKAVTRKLTNLLIKNLAIADLLVTLTIMPYSVLHLFFKPNQWFGGPAGTVTCKAIFYALPVSIAASIITMVVISLERFCTIYCPLRQTLLRNGKTLTAVIWLISLISMSPYLLLFNVVHYRGFHFCLQRLPWTDDPQEVLPVLKIFYIILFVLFYVLPLLGISFLNIITARRLWFHNARGTNSRTASELRRRSVVKMLMIIVLAFTLCWLPAHVMHYFFLSKQAKIPKLTGYLLFWVSHSNSAINPLLYMAFNRRFRCACLNVSIALLRSPFHAISACANHPSPQKSIPTEFRTNKQPARQREDRAFCMEPVASACQNRPRGLYQETKV